MQQVLMLKQRLRFVSAPQIRSTILALYKLVCMYVYVCSCSATIHRGWTVDLVCFWRKQFRLHLLQLHCKITWSAASHSTSAVHLRVADSHR